MTDELEIKEATPNQCLAVLHVTNLGFELDRLGIEYKTELYTNPSWNTRFSGLDKIGGFYEVNVNFEQSDGYSGGWETSTRHPKGSLKMKVRYAGSGRGCSGTFKAASPSINYAHIAEKIAEKVRGHQERKDRQAEATRVRAERDTKLDTFIEKSNGFWKGGYTDNRKITTPFVVGEKTTITLIFKDMNRAFEVAEAIQTNWPKKISVKTN